MDDVPEIIIHVISGVVTVVKKPLGVVLKIVDFDNSQSDEPRSEEVWTEMDMTREE